MALVDTGAQCSRIYSKPEQFLGPSAHVDGYGGQTVKVKSVYLPLRNRMALCADVYCRCVSDPGIYFGDKCSARSKVANLLEGILSPGACGEGCCEGIFEAFPTVTTDTSEGDSCETVPSTRGHEEIVASIAKLAKVGLVQPVHSLTPQCGFSRLTARGG